MDTEDHDAHRELHQVSFQISEAEDCLRINRFDQATAHAALATALATRAQLVLAEEAHRPIELVIPEPVHPRTGPVPDDEDLTPREHFELVFGPVDDEKWQWLKEFALRHPVTGGRPTWVEVDEQTLDADEVAKVGSDVSAERREVRLGLVRAGFRRTGSSADHGDGAYNELWTGDLGDVTLDWRARS